MIDKELVESFVWNNLKIPVYDFFSNEMGLLVGYYIFPDRFLLIIEVEKKISISWNYDSNEEGVILTEDKSKDYIYNSPKESFLETGEPISLRIKL